MSRTLFSNGLAFDGTSDEARPGLEVPVEGGRIAAVPPRATGVAAA